MPDTQAFEVARRASLGVALHDAEAFEGMRRAGRLAAEVLDLMVPEVQPGVTTAHLDKLAF
jgi:methionyl aminopeptidase